MIKIIIEVEGMKCPMCEKHTNEAINKLPNIKSVVSSHKENKTEIISETDIPDEVLKEALCKTGYSIGTISREEYKEKKGFFARFKK